MQNLLEEWSVMRWGAMLALLTLLYGFGLGGAFGAFEDGIKGHLKGKATAVLAGVYGNDEAKMKSVLDKSWMYLKRSHLHAGGLGTAALALMFLLAALPVAPRWKAVIALGQGAGALGYSVFWMWAGLIAPGLGSVMAAKESLQWLAVPSSGLCLLSLASVTVLSFSFLIRKSSGGTAG
ncbi:MAG: hypothetical protein HY360_22840 [Verrucomicrobia bacterium]|nr:hypothetical protein [Verrucomicrobiota bacterium]